MAIPPKPVAIMMLAWLAACSTQSTMPEAAGYGAHPVLPPRQHTLIPTINIAKATPWSGADRPTAAAGLRVDEFARDLQHPRWLKVLPNGDVLVAESDAPPKPDDAKGVRGWIMKKVMRRAGSGLASANRITLLRDADGDGRAETRSVLLGGLHSPIGMALVGDELYVADTDALLRFPYRQGDLAISAAGIKVLDLPAGTINHHWTRNVIASADGQRLYVTVGSNSNAGENGMDQEERRAAILEVDPSGSRSRVYASGLRNPNGMDWQPQSGALWVVVNERDELGNDLVPDYLTSVRDGDFYGWPYSYFGSHPDDRAQPPRPDLVKTARVPDYALGAHTASLGLAFYAGGGALPGRYAGGAFIGQHGSWNRKPRSGYKVVFVPFENGTPSGLPQDVLTGFLDERGHARGRPVGVAIDAHGDLLVADDVGGRVWRVTAGP